MNIFDFISQDEIEELPDDPQSAFTSFIRTAQDRLTEKTSKLDENEQSEWRQIEDARHGFMNVVIAAAKKYNIEPFSSLEVPRLDSFNINTHRQFKADLDHYMTQLLLDNSIRGRKSSVPVLEKDKDRIKTYLNALRDCVRTATLTDAKRETLLKKLNEFEKELDKTRLNLIAVSLFTFELLAIPGGVWASAEIANRLITNVLQVVGEAKAADDEARRLPPVTVPAKLSPPRREEPAHRQAAEMDDEIPF
jgi:hypothetical protein